MNEEVVIFGTGGLGRIALEVIEDMNNASLRYEIVGFIDDNPLLVGSQVNGYEVLGGLNWLAEHSDHGVILAVGSCVARMHLAGKINALGARSFPSVIHPMAKVSARSAIGVGAILGPYCVVQADASVGRFLYLSSSSTIGHDARVGDFVSVAPNVCVVGGGVVGDGAELGTGSVVLPSAPVGKWVQVGANATVTKRIPDMSVAVGTPAKVIRTRQLDF